MVRDRRGRRRRCGRRSTLDGSSFRSGPNVPPSPIRPSGREQISSLRSRYHLDQHATLPRPSKREEVSAKTPPVGRNARVPGLLPGPRAWASAIPCCFRQNLAWLRPSAPAVFLPSPLSPSRSSCLPSTVTFCNGFLLTRVKSWLGCPSAPAVLVSLQCSRFHVLLFFSALLHLYRAEALLLRLPAFHSSRHARPQPAAPLVPSSSKPLSLFRPSPRPCPPRGCRCAYEQHQNPCRAPPPHLHGAQFALSTPLTSLFR